ncbi:Uncharacterised protein [Chlamydia abortus]|nr:Uncharacterised protein [Chlamydia abortus]
MNERQALQWKKKRQMGKSKFLVNYCILGFGLSTAVILTLLELISMHDLFWQFAIIRLVVFPIIAVLFGIGYWESKERKYSEFAETHTTNTSRS